MAGMKLAEPWLPEVYEIVSEETELLHQSREEDELSLIHIWCDLEPVWRWPLWTGQIRHSRF